MPLKIHKKYLERISVHERDNCVSTPVTYRINLAELSLFYVCDGTTLHHACLLDLLSYAVWYRHQSIHSIPFIDNLNPFTGDYVSSFWGTVITESFFWKYMWGWYLFLFLSYSRTLRDSDWLLYRPIITEDSQVISQFCCGKTITLSFVRLVFSSWTVMGCFR